MNCTKFFSVFLFSILTLLGVAADEIDRATPFQIKLFKFNDAYAAELLKNDTMLDACNTDALNALIDEAISDDVIWGSKVNGETASFAYMLSAYLNHTVSPDKIKNPFLIYMFS